MPRRCRAPHGPEQPRLDAARACSPAQAERTAWGAVLRVPCPHASTRASLKLSNPCALDTSRRRVSLVVPLFRWLLVVGWFGGLVGWVGI